jgi:hypothetical protein
MAKQLVNFLIDQKDLKKLNRVAGMMGRTRTSILIELIRQYCVDQAIEYQRRSRLLDDLNKACDQNQAILDRYHPDETEQDMEMPSIFFTDGHDTNF